MWWTLLKTMVGLTLYGTAIEPRIVVRNDERAVIPGLPPAWEGKQVAVFADLQVGMLLANIDAARRLVHRVVELRPAFVLIAGDFVYESDESPDQQMQRVLDILGPLLRDTIPIYSVLGNHDYSLMNEHSDQDNALARVVLRVLDSAGVHVMDNRARALTIAGRDSLWLAGIGEKWAKNDRVAETMSQIPASVPRVVFMHDPDSFVQIAAGEAPLAVAAHTHGMQLGIPWVSDYLWRHYFSDEGMGVEGWQRGKGNAGNNLYINRGIGFSVIPARVHAFPELTVFTLTRGPRD